MSIEDNKAIIGSRKSTAIKLRLPGSPGIFTRLGLGLALLVGLCLALGVQVRPAHAAQTLNVTDCTSDAQLRMDIATANSDNAGDIITFSCSGDIKLASTLTITGNMTLDGRGQSVILDGQDQVEVLKVNSGVSFTLNALTIAHGHTPGVGGGLLNDGTVSITNSTFAYNSSANPGGALINENGGTVNITNSTFAYNLVTGYASGGGLFQFNGGTVNITNSTFVGNGAASGTTVAR